MGAPHGSLQMTPRAGFMPVDIRAAMLKHIQGKLWIDKQEVQWAKAERT